MLKAGVSALTLFSAAVSAEVLYFQDFDNGSMGGVTNSAYTVASTVNGSTNTNWRVHNGSNSLNSAEPGHYVSTAKGNMVGHSSSYQNKEKSIFTFSVNTTGFTNLSLMFDWGAVFRTDDSLYDGVSIIAYKGILDTDTTGGLSKTLNPILVATGGEFKTPNALGVLGYLGEAQYGAADNSLPGVPGLGDIAYKGGQCHVRSDRLGI